MGVAVKHQLLVCDHDNVSTNFSSKSEAFNLGKLKCYSILNKMVASASNVFDTFEPLAMFLKIIGFLPIFWHENCTTRQRVMNAIGLVLNVALSFAVAYCIVSSFITHGSRHQEFIILVSNNCALLVLSYGTPVVLIITGFVLADPLKRTFLQVYQCDVKARMVF